MDIASLLKVPDSKESSTSPTTQYSPQASIQSLAVATSTAPAPIGPSLYAGPTSRLGHASGPPTLSVSGKRSMPLHAVESPAKKQTKWSPEEDALIIELRGSGMKWEDISKRLPGRSAISCRLHYQNYLERRSEWDDERKTKLARLYDRCVKSASSASMPLDLCGPHYCAITGNYDGHKGANFCHRLKPEMWAKVAEEMSVPWRAVEAMHWQLGETEMARRAGVTPFSLSATSADNFGQGNIRPPPRGHAHSRSQGSIYRDAIDPSRAYGRNVVPNLPPGPSSKRPLGPAPRKDSGVVPLHMPVHHEHGEPLGYSHSGGPLAPIQTQSQSRPGTLPGLAELTTGVSPYSTPAYSIGIPTVSPAHSATASPGPFFSAMTYPAIDSAGSKRRRSPDLGPGDPNRRRQLDHPALEQSIPRHMP